MRVGVAARAVGGLGLVVLAALVPCGAAGASRVPSAASAPAPVDVVEVSGLLDRITARSITDAISRSASNGAQALVLQVNTRGAVIPRAEMAELLGAMKDSAVPVAVWVGPSGSRLYGLPAQMAAVADVVAMAPGTRIGRTGTPLSVDGEEVSFGPAGASISRGDLGFLEAREAGVLKFTGDDRGVPVLRNILLALDGLEVRGRTLDTVVETVAAGGQVSREATTMRFFKLGLVPRLFHTVASPSSAYLLVTVGLALVVFEFFTAGVGIAALVGVTALVLGATGLGALPLAGWALALLVASFLAFAVDVQVGVPRLWTGIGLASYVVASFGLFRDVDAASLRPGWVTLVVCISGIALTYIVGMPSMTRTRFATPTIGRDNLIGALGTAAGPVGPEGLVTVNGARWRARVNRATPLADGQSMRVVAIDGITLEVEPLEGAARDYREMRNKSE